MEFTSFIKERIDYKNSVIDNAGYKPYYLSIQSDLGDPLIIDGKEFVNFASNNYLGIANDQRLKNAHIEAIEKYGVSMCATPIAGGYSENFELVRQKLSDFIGVENVLIYPSCYQANNGIFSALIRNDDLVLFDRYVHSSMIEGIRTTGCKMLPFEHNSPDAVDYLLGKHNNHNTKFVVTESVFSTEGSIAPFAELNKVCLKQNAVPVIDDSHGIGVIGKKGKGILNFSGVGNYQGIYTTSLGKALATNCGVVGATNQIIDYLSYFSSHLIYSTAVSPAVLAGVNKVIDILEDEFDQRSERMFRYSKMIKEAMKHTGFNVADGILPITSVKCGSSDCTVQVAKQLFDKNILTTPFVYPSVPKNDGRVRMIAGANLSQNTLEKAIEIIKNIECKEQ